MSDASAPANERPTDGGLVLVRCPRCNRLACEATAGSWVRVKCARCGWLFECNVALGRL